MGITYATIDLFNATDLDLQERGELSETDVRHIQVRALVDSGASLLTIPESIRDCLKLRTVDHQQAELADGSLIAVDVVGPIELRFENRITITSAVVISGETVVLLGAIPMQAMDVLIDPKLERLIVNPQSPDRARMLLK